MTLLRQILICKMVHDREIGRSTNLWSRTKWSRGGQVKVKHRVGSEKTRRYKILIVGKSEEVTELSIPFQVWRWFLVAFFGFLVGSDYMSPTENSVILNEKREVDLPDFRWLSYSAHILASLVEWVKGGSLSHISLYNELWGRNGFVCLK